MKIILEKDVPKLGRAGDTKEVADGFARNFLIPRRLAAPHSPGAERANEARRSVRAKKSGEEIKAAQEFKAKVEKVELAFSVLVDDKNELYGSVSKGQILKALRVKGVVVNREAKLELPSPLKALGTFSVPLRLHSEVVADIRVTIAKSEPAAP
ncbi:MAG: 50S ribosomal protein L9 [Elusimicrobia bacterium]|nr:50S ribosomal protein L9 [Elusimicrobiota bacterium]